ncbi:hypothetical protein [Ensifer adhaerens]|uniref:hypothetical protein n=1 Tax=Ensifer adhaerens TaxID=106592 RepID=UPI00128F7E7B|nr:hypothetical protein [Ensifer adhaerens]
MLAAFTSAPDLERPSRDERQHCHCDREDPEDDGDLALKQDGDVAAAEHHRGRCGNGNSLADLCKDFSLLSPALPEAAVRCRFWSEIRPIFPGNPRKSSVFQVPVFALQAFAKILANVALTANWFA